jgi:fatty acid-binding protein DegV
LVLGAVIITLPKEKVCISFEAVTFSGKEKTSKKSIKKIIKKKEGGGREPPEKEVGERGRGRQEISF